MIIGNNNPINKNFASNNVNTTQPSENNNFTQSFDQRFNMVKEQAKKNAGIINTFATDNNTMQHSNVMSKSEMADKSFSMLQERLNNGTITLDEFNKKCAQLGKLRQKQ